jgi:hypothetical protein
VLFAGLTDRPQDAAVSLRRAAGIPGLGAIAALALTGCGASAPEVAPTKSQFIARADAICGSEEQRLRRAAALGRSASASDSEVRHLTRELATIHQDATTRIESLPRPAGETARIATWLTARTVAATFELDTAEAPPGEDSTATNDMRAALARASARVRALSSSYGFRVCGVAE